MTKPARWPIALVAMSVAAIVAWRHGLAPETIELGAAVVVLAVAAAHDCESRTIPNACIAALLAVRAAYLCTGLGAGFAAPAEAASSLAGATVLGGGLLALAIALDRIFRTDTIGGGDIKLFLVTGAYFGIEVGCIAVFAACALGLAGNRFFGDGSDRFAFGPAIALAFGIVMCAL